MAQHKGQQGSISIRTDKDMINILDHLTHRKSKPGERRTKSDIIRELIANSPDFIHMQQELSDPIQ